MTRPVRVPGAGVWLSDAVCADIYPALVLARRKAAKEGAGVSGETFAAIALVAQIGSAYRMRQAEPADIGRNPVPSSETAARYLSVQEAAGELHRSPRWIRELVNEGRLPASRLGARGSWMVDADAVAQMRKRLVEKE